MTKIKTTYLGELRTEAVHEQSGTKIITDAPLDNHGKGESFSPTDLVAAALGSCMLTIMGISAESYGFVLKGTTLEIEKIMSANPRRIAEIKIVLTFPEGNNYTDQQKRIIESAAKTCPVANSLGEEVKKTLVFNY
jgi:putative redox protein